MVVGTLGGWLVGASLGSSTRTSGESACRARAGAVGVDTVPVGSAGGGEGGGVGSAFPWLGIVVGVGVVVVGAELG